MGRHYRIPSPAKRAAKTPAHPSRAPCQQPRRKHHRSPRIRRRKIKGVGIIDFATKCIHDRQTPYEHWLTCFSSEHYRGHDGVQVHKSVRKRYALEIAIWQRVRCACSLARRRSGSARGCLRWRFYSSDGTLVEDAFVVKTAHCRLHTPAG